MGVFEESKGRLKLALGEISTPSAPRTEQQVAPLPIFISYAHEDEALKDKLLTHLAGLRRLGFISTWNDKQITAGAEWQPEISSELKQAAIVLLLISSDFISSEFCWQNEMTTAIRAHDAGTQRVIPVLLRKCDWKGLPFSKLNAIPADGVPVASWPSIDEALTHVAHMIRRVVEELNGRE